MSDIKKVLANVAQDLSAAEKAQARQNIGAAGNGFVEISTSATFAQVKAILDAGNIPYLVTTNSGYRVVYHMAVDGGNGQYTKSYTFIYTQTDQVVEKLLKNDNTWTTTTRALQSELTAGDFIDITSSEISMKKTEATDFWGADDSTTRVVAFEDSPQSPVRNYRKIMDIPSAKIGTYRVDFSVRLRVGNLPQISLDNRPMRIIVCKGDKTDAVQIAGTHGVVFNLPDGATTGTIVNVTGTMLARCATANTLTLNIFNDSGTGSVDESYYIDYSCVYAERIA